ncbi:hypothetical protein [Desulfovibrio sp. ZJ200]|uniref:hypothetical protein n=1 Tax=Desulfovibrio sp. ZJ200 TaxID=2709792 RepID=UPI0013EB8760|nr:hypothetical protein [Desulfovibrio sp. ZJ200]
MKLSSLFMLLSVLCLCACQGTYKQYVPAPNEMPADAAFFTDQQRTPEELISVQSTQNANPYVLQAIMKTRGFVYKGYRVIKSQYSLSISDIKKAAYEIGASHALYFITDQKTVCEEKEKIDIGNLLVDILDAKGKSDYQMALKRGLHTTRSFENVTYYTYYITYWKKTNGDKSILLNDSEITLLKDEQKTLRRTISELQKQMKSIERQKKSMQSVPAKIPQHDNNALVEITSQLSKINEQVQQMKAYQEEVHQAIDRNDVHQAQMHFRDIPSK